MNRKMFPFVRLCFEMFRISLLYNMFLIQIVREGNKFIFFFSCPKCFRVFFDTFTSLVLDRDN